MSSTLIYILIVFVLILIEGVFVAAEIALVSLREGQVRVMAEDSRRGAMVEKLVSDPNRFLATVQIGVTSTALLSSAFGAVTLSEQAKKYLVSQGMGDGLAGAVGIVGVTLVISFITLVLGELAPKRLSLQSPEAVAKTLSPALARLATFFRPVIWLLSRSTDLVVRALGADPNAGKTAISEDELRGLVAAHESLSNDERRLIDDVFAAGERSVGEVMIPRTDVVFLDAGLSVSRATKTVLEAPHSRYPVVQGGDHDEVLGFVHIRDLVLPDRDRSLAVRDFVRELKRVPASKKVLVAMSEMRREGHHVALVVDEYGGTDGIVTLEDLIEEIVGDIRDEYDSDQQAQGRLAGGKVEIDALSNLDEFAERTGQALPAGPYATVGGYVMAQLGRLPAEGDVIEQPEFTVTVLALEGRRVARVLFCQRPDVPAEDGGTPEADTDRTPPLDATTGLPEVLGPGAPSTDVPAAAAAPAAVTSAAAPAAAAGARPS